MKVIVDVPDKYIDASKALISLMTDDDDDINEVAEDFEKLKGSEVELDLSVMSKEKAKEFSIGLIMILVAQGQVKKKGED